MSLDTFANIADIVSIPIGIIGIILVLHQLYLTRVESEKEHLRTKNEMTLNAYSIMRKDLGVVTAKVRNKLGIEDMFDHVTEEQIDMIMSDKNLRKDVSQMLSMLNKFAVGVKHDIFNIDIINELSGKYFIKTHKQFEPYLRRVRKNSDTLYLEYDNLVAKLKQMREEEIKNREANRANRKVETKSISEIFLSKSEKMAEILTILGVIGMLLSVGIVYFNNIYTLPTFLIKAIIGFFIFIIILILIQLFFALKRYLELSSK